MLVKTDIQRTKWFKTTYGSLNTHFNLQEERNADIPQLMQ
jgi:hypothetical protein